MLRHIRTTGAPCWSRCVTLARGARRVRLRRERAGGSATDPAVPTEAHRRPRPPTPAPRCTSPRTATTPARARARPRCARSTGRRSSPSRAPRCAWRAAALRGRRSPRQDVRHRRRPITYVSEPGGAAEVVGTGGDGSGLAQPRRPRRHRRLHDHRRHLDGLSARARSSGSSATASRASPAATASRRRAPTTPLHDIDVIGNVVSGCGDSALDHGIYVSHPGGTVANNISYGNAGFGIHCWHNCNRLVDLQQPGVRQRRGRHPHRTGRRPEPRRGRRRQLPRLQQHRRRQRRVRHRGERRDRAEQPLPQQQRVRQRWRAGWTCRPARRWGRSRATPEFVDFRPDGTGDYRLHPNSPIIDAGTTEGALGMDIVGTSRPRGAGVDIGVYER